MKKNKLVETYIFLRTILKKIIFKIFSKNSSFINFFVKIDILLRKTNFLKTALNGKFTYDNYTFYYNKNDLTVASSVLTNGSYEPETLDAILSNLKSGNIFIDGGSNIGFYSILASEIVGESGKVLSFEPTKITRKYLMQNINENKINNIFVSHLAITSFDGDVVFNLTNEPESNSIVQKDHDNVKGQLIKQKGIKIDTFCQNQKIRKVDLIKLDIEGQELEAIKGAESIIKNSKDLKIIFELNIANNPDGKNYTLKIFNQLKTFGYNHFELLLNPKLIITNFDDDLELSKIIKICNRFNVNVLAKKE